MPGGGYEDNVEKVGLAKFELKYLYFYNSGQRTPFSSRARCHQYAHLTPYEMICN